MLKRIILVALLLCATAIAARATDPANYHLAQKYVIGGDGSWDYLTFDPVGKRLFISRSTRVQVVDPSNGSLIAEIPDTNGVHGIALAQDLDKGFTSNGRDPSVTVFDLKSLKQTAKIALASQGPDAIVYEPASQRVVTLDGRSSDATLIDAKTNKVVATVPLGSRPEFAAADGNGMVYDNLEDKNEVVAIDTRKAAVVATWPLAPCDGPGGMAMDRLNRRLFIGCGNKLMMVLNADSGKIITTLPIGDGSDAVGFDPGTNLAFSSNGEGTLTVVHEDTPDTFSVAQTATTQQYARTLAVDTTNHDVYEVTAQMDIAPSPVPSGSPRRSVHPGTFTVLVMAP